MEKGKVVCERIVSLVLDGTEQGIVKSTDVVIEGESFSGKYMDSTVVILVGCDPSEGKALFVSDSFLGSKNDQNCFNAIDWSEILCECEWILADKGFSGENVIRKHTKYSGVPLTEMQKAENREIDEHRIIIENVFGWCKKFAICGDNLRVKSFRGCSGSSRLLQMHNGIWRIVLAVYNSYSSVRANVIK